MYGRMWRIGILLALLSVVLVTCKSPGVTEPIPILNTTVPTGEVFPIENPNTVILTFACYSWDHPIFTELANDFHALNPGIRIELVTLEEMVDLSSRPSMIDATRQLVSAADTAYWTVVYEATHTGLLYDLRPFIEADTAFEPDDFFPHVLEAFQWEGGTWALPSQAVPTMIFYDKAAFDAAGVSYPQPGWTRDDFLATAQQLTVHTGSEVERYGYVDLFGGMVEALVLAPFNAVVGETPALDTPAVADAVRWTTDLALRHQITPNPWVPSPPSDGPWAVAHALVDGHCAAMWSDTLANYKDCSRSFELGVVPFPQTGERSTPAWMYGYMISAGTTHPREAWRWLNFLTRQRIEGSDGAHLDRVAARRSVAEQTYYWERFDEETKATVRYAAEHLLFPTYEAANAELALAVRRVFEGQPVEEALAEAQAALQESLAQAAQVTPVPIVVATPRPVGAAGKTTITFAPPSPDTATYRQLATAFNEESPDIQVQLVSPSEADSADCFAGFPSLTDEGSRAELLNLQPLIEADGTFSLDNFYPRFLDAFRHQGNLWGLPTQAQVRAVFYNRNLFDAAGTPYPQPGWTMDDFLSRAKALTQGSGGDKQYGFLPLNGDVSDLPVFLALQGAALWDEAGRPRFDAPDVVAAVRWYADLVLKHGVAPTFPDDMPERDPAAQETRYALVRKGRVAMWTDFTGTDRSDVWPTDAQVGMAPLPALSAAERPVGMKGVTEFLYEGLFIASDTPHPQACWEWLKFASAQAAPVRGLPARRSLLESADFAEQAGQDAVETYRASLEYADASILPTSEASAQLHWVYQALTDILKGARPEMALAEAQRQAEE